MHISLPAPLKEWVEQKVDEKGFSTASEFVRDLLRQEQERERTLRARIDQQLIEGINSGPARRMTKKDWQRIRSEGMKLARKLRSR